MGHHASVVPAAGLSVSHRTGKIQKSGSTFLLFLLISCLVPALHAQQASDCLTCHGSSVGLKNSAGKDISVNPSTHMRGPHSAFTCTDCHAGAATQGHTAKTASATCLTCHADAA